VAIRNQYVLGIDLGTSGVKSVVFGADGTVAGTATAPLDLAMPRPGWSEQDPAQWWDTTCASVRAVLIRTAITPTEIGGIGISGQMHGAVLLDAGGAVLRLCILWNDQRSAPQCAEIARRAGGSARIHHLARTAPDVFRSSGGTTGAAEGTRAPRLLP